MDKPRFSPESPYVWIQDQYHPQYPHYVKILEVLEDGYRAQVGNGPILFLREDQLSDDLIGG